MFAQKKVNFFQLSLWVVWAFVLSLKIVGSLFLELNWKRAKSGFMILALRLKLFMIDSRVLWCRKKKRVLNLIRYVSTFSNQIFVEWLCDLIFPSFLPTNYSQKLLKKIGAKICCVISEQTAYPPSATHPSRRRDTSFNELHDVKSRWKETSRKSIDIKWFFLRLYSNRRVLTLSYVFMSRKCQSEYDKATFFCCCVVAQPIILIYFLFFFC